MIMANKVELRYTRVSDAKRVLEILGNPNFIYTNRKTSTLEEEKAMIRNFPTWRKERKAFIYVILYGEKVVGGCNLNINQNRKHVAEVGYFIDQAYWGKGIATKALRKLAKFGFDDVGLKRIELMMDPRNIASERVAIKCGFQKEAVKRKAVMTNGIFNDMYLYAKVK